jgi:hypothetical protein
MCASILAKWGKNLLFVTSYKMAPNQSQNGHQSEDSYISLHNYQSQISNFDHQSQNSHKPRDVNRILKILSSENLQGLSGTNRKVFLSQWTATAGILHLHLKGNCSLNRKKLVGAEAKIWGFSILMGCLLQITDKVNKLPAAIGME